MQRYRKLISHYSVSGVLFAILQGYGFILHGHGVLKMHKAVIHLPRFWPLLPVCTYYICIGWCSGVLLLFLKVFSTKSSIQRGSIEIATTYWHFVDILWCICLFSLCGYSNMRCPAF